MPNTLQMTKLLISMTDQAVSLDWCWQDSAIQWAVKNGCSLKKVNPDFAYEITFYTDKVLNDFVRLFLETQVGKKLTIEAVKNGAIKGVKIL